MPKRRQPAAVFHVGTFVADELAARQWTIESLADATRRRVLDLSGVGAGDRRLSASGAALLGALFGTSAEFWINLQAQYDRGEA